MYILERDEIFLNSIFSLLIFFSCFFFFFLILGDPGGDSGAEDENQNGREKIRRAKVRKKNTSPWVSSAPLSAPGSPRMLFFLIQMFSDITQGLRNSQT